MNIKTNNIKRVNAGALQGFATVTIKDGALGDITIKDWRIIKQEGQAPWVSVPQKEFKTRDGERKFVPLITVPKELKDAVEKVILAAYESKSDQRDDIPF